MTVMFSTPAGRQTGRSGVDRIAMEYRRRYGVNPSPDVVNRMIQGLDAARYEIPETPQSILDMPLGGERNQAIHAFKQPHFDKRTQLREGVTLESLGIGAPSSNFFDQATTGTGSGWTASFKAITGVASNPDDDVNPLWTKDSADTSTYTVSLEGDNGTKETSETSYSFASTGSPSNIKGSMGLDSGDVGDGIGVITTNVRFKPSSS